MRADDRPPAARRGSRSTSVTPFVLRRDWVVGRWPKLPIGEAADRMSRSGSHQQSDTRPVARPARRVAPRRVPDVKIPGQVWDELVEILAAAVLVDMTRDPAVPAGSTPRHGLPGERRTG